jgi:transposase
MPAFTFPPEDLDAIRHDRFRHPHPRVQLKMEVLWLKSRGLPHEEIAALAGTSLRSVQRFLAEYRAGGLDRVRALGWRGKPDELAPHRESLEAHFLEHPPRSVSGAQAAIERITGVKRGPTQVRAFLKRRSACAGAR